MAHQWKSFWGILLCTLALGTQANSQIAQAKTKNTLNWTESSELATADISQASDTLSFDVLLNTQEGLYRLDAKGKAQPALATKTKVSADGLTYTFNLRKNVKWSDNTPVTAQDFVTSWRRTVDPKTGSSDAFYLNQVQNAKQINANKLPVEKLGIQALSKHKLQVKLTQPVPYFKKLLAWPLFFPQNQAAVNRWGKDYGTTSAKTVADGPFILKGWNGSSDNWRLVKNPHYWDKKHVRLQQVKEDVVKDPQTGLNLYQSNKVDETILSGTQVPNLKGQKDFLVRKSSNMTDMNLNQSKVPAFKNQKVRRAFSLAINRHQLVKGVLEDGSLAPKGFVPQGLGSYQNKDFAQISQVPNSTSSNLKQAKSLLRQGLKQTNTKQLNLSLLIDDTTTSKQTGEFIQGSLNKLPHVKITLKTLPKVQRLAREHQGDYDLVITSWQSVFSDPINFLDIWESDSSYNTSKFHDARFDHDLDLSENKFSQNKAQRWQYQVKAEKRLMKLQGTVPLYQGVKAQLLNTKVKGLVYNGSGVPYDFKTTYFSSKKD